MAAQVSGDTGTSCLVQRKHAVGIPRSQSAEFDLQAGNEQEQLKYQLFLICAVIMNNTDKKHVQTVLSLNIYYICCFKVKTFHSKKKTDENTVSER